MGKQPRTPRRVRRAVEDATGRVIEGMGELFSCTPYTFDGYLDDAAKTREALRDDGYCSVGDMARRDERGYIHLVDRKSNMIISGGENVYPSEIENILGRYDGVKDVAVIGVPHDKWGEAVHAVIVLHPGHEAREADVIAWCRDKMAGFKRPRSVRSSRKARCRARPRARSCIACCATNSAARADTCSTSSRRFSG